MPGGPSVWTAAEINRLGLRPRPGDQLTPSEKLGAELAATGLTNRQVAEAHGDQPEDGRGASSSRRKLGIHSRAQLGARMGISGGSEVTRS